VRLSELDLANFVRIRSDALRVKLDRSRFETQVDIEEDLPHASGDLLRLGHVFDSLVLNAAKFSDLASLGPGERGKISIEVKLSAVSELPEEFREPSWGKKTGLYLVTCIQSSLPSIGETPDHF